MTSIFITPEDLAILTGRKIKSKQIEALRQMGMPFKVNACGHPIVTIAAVEGRKETAPPEVKRWVPNVLKDKQ